MQKHIVNSLPNIDMNNLANNVIDEKEQVMSLASKPFYHNNA